MSPVTARLSPRAAILCLAVIALVGLSIALFAVTRAPGVGGSAETTFANPHSHEGGSISPAAPVSAQERARAAGLVSSTATALRGYADVGAAEAAGYRWVGDDGGRYRHYVNASYFLDDNELDPAHIESLVYRTRDDGSLELVSGMYILAPGTPADAAPDVGGALTPWHVHTNLCFGAGGMITGTTDAGACPKGSINVDTPPMLHVWVAPNPDGPFAAIDENGIVAAHE